VKRFPKRSSKSKRFAITPDVRAYVRKIDAYRAGRDPIALMKQGPGKFERAVAGLSAARMRKRPARGKWSIIEILGHLNDTEVVYGYRIRLSLSQSGATILGYDQAKWTEELRHRRANAKRLLTRIRVLRESNLETVQRLPRTAWKRYGRHSERGNESVRRVLELVAGHDLNHLDQIKAIRKKYGW
jgi:uncharacterized damage-inducible protein DinB